VKTLQNAEVRLFLSDINIYRNDVRGVPTHMIWMLIITNRFEGVRGYLKKLYFNTSKLAKNNKKIHS
jgi:hypothetical protein